MDSAKFRNLVDLLGEALELPPDHREKFLLQRCGDDGELLAEARSLLQEEDSNSLAAATSALEARIGQAASQVAQDLESHPKQIGPYRILEILGEGGMGTVYHAEQEQPIRREVALKVIRPGLGGASAVTRFESERQTLAVMDHPNIARVYDAGNTPDGSPYFVMELVSGVPITRYCDEHKLDLDTRLHLFAQVCQAVQHAHHKGIIHRDLKPTNVLVSEIDGHGVPKIIDFGIAKATEFQLNEASLFTEEGVLLGTLEYMSPEQARLAAGDIDTRADVYSLGVMLYELVSGQLPFTSESLRGKALLEIQRIIIEKDPPQPSQILESAGMRGQTAALERNTDFKALKRQLQGDLGWVIMKALEKDPERRYQAAQDLAQELQRIRKHEPVEAGPPSIRYRAAKFARRHRAGVLAAAIVMLALLTGTALATVGFVRATRAQMRAEQEAANVQAVNEFLTDMLASIQPEKALGEVMTVREILDEAAGRMQQGESFEGQPLVEASLSYTIGESYGALGEYDTALPLLERALTLRRRELGESDERVVQTLDAIGSVYWNKGDLQESLHRAQEVLAIRERTVGKLHLDYSTALGNIANVYADMGEYARAEVLQREALAIDRQVLDEGGGKQLAISLNNLATVLADQQKFTEAADLHRESLVLRRRFMGERSPAVAVSLSNLGFSLAGAGNHAEAEIYYRESAAMATEVYGLEHPQTAIVWTNLSGTLRENGEYAEAEAYLLKALSVFSTSTGEKSWAVGAIRANLGVVMVAMQREAEAEEQLLQSWDILSESLGESSDRARKAAQSLMNLYEASGETALAATWQRRAEGPSE